MNRLPLPLLGLLAAGLVACGGRDPAIVPASPLLGAPRTALTPPASAVPVNPGTASRPGDLYTGPAATTRRDEAALADACRRDADRIVTFRDRGQLMREDDRDARVGTDASIYARRMETERLSRRFERDQLADECVRQNTASPPQQQPQPQQPRR